MRRRVAIRPAGAKLAALPAVAMSLLLVLSGCVPPAPDDPDDSSPSAWEDCFDKARDSNEALDRNLTVECTTVTVPKDWNAPDDGETFDISAMRIYSGDLADKQGSVLTNPGGPGGSGLTFLPGLVDRLGPLMDEFAIVSFDPRGVGESEPVDCISDEDLDASFSAEPDPVEQAAYDEVVEIYRRIGEGCGDAYGGDLPLFSTVQAAKDMDAVRAAVGDEQLTYLGFSYGTLLGAVYAQLFPDKIRAMVLDGAVNPLADSIESSEGQAMGFERALTNFSTWCQSNRSRCPISDDPRGAITEQIEKARTSPVRGPDGRDATAGWVLWGVILSMYSQDIWEYLGPAIDNLSNGDATLILLLADTYAERDEQGHYTNLFDANSAVNCADGDYPSLEEIRDLQSQWRTKYPMFGTSLAMGLLTCSLWPGEKDPYPTGPADTPREIVVIGTTGDPATPYESTQKLADMLGEAVVLTWEGEGHTAYPETSCIRRAVDNYLIDLTVPEDGLRCPAS